MSGYGITEKLFYQGKNNRTSTQSYIYATIEDPFNRIQLHRRILNVLINKKKFKFNSDEIELIKKFPYDHIPITLIPTLFHNIIQNNFPYNEVYTIPIDNYYLNTIIYIQNDEYNINLLDQFCKESGLCYCLFDNIPNIENKFKYFNKEESQDIGNSDIYTNKNINGLNHGSNSPRKQINLKYCFIRKYRYHSFIINNNYTDELNNKLINFKNYFRYRWIHALLPMYTENSKTIINMTNYIWHRFNNSIKLKIGIDDLFKLGLHPLQLLGSTSLILFRRNYTGKEYCLENCLQIFRNSAIHWTYNNLKQSDLYAIIFKIINYRYNYIGSCPYENILRLPLIIYNSGNLEDINYPKDSGIAYKNIIDNFKIEQQLELQYANVVNYAAYTNAKRIFIQKYFRIINN